MQHLVDAGSRHARAITGFGIRALLLLVLTFSPIVYAQTSTFCPVLNATVASGGSVSINAGSCHVGFGLGVVLVPPTHGTATIGAFGPNQTINYSHNGNSATSDSFVVNDGEAPPNNRILVNITITPPASSIVVNPGALPAMTVGVPFSQTLSSTGGSSPYTYTPSGGPLPPGLTLSTAGVISGTPTQRGSYTFSVRSQDSLGAFAIKGYTGTAQTPTLSISPASATVVQNLPFSRTIAVSGGIAPYSFLHEVVAGPLPPGMTLSSTGVLSGTPTTLGATTFQMRVTDSSSGPGSYFELENFSFTVVAPPSVSIGVTPASVLEDGAGTFQYTVTRSANLSVPTTVNITAGGTATGGSDYTGGVATIVIPAGATTATFTIDPTPDTTVEPDETVIMTVAPGTGYTVGSPSSATGTIQNDDVDPCAAVSFPYTLPNNLPATLTLAIECANANGTADVINFNGQTVTLTASAGNFSGATGLPRISTPVTLRNGTLTRSGSNQFRLLHVSNTGNLTLRDMTLSNGGGATYASDAGIVSAETDSTLTIINSTVSGSSVGNSSSAGGIFASGTFNLINSTVSGNTAGRGGGLVLQNGPALISNSVISGNVATNAIGGGGAMYLPSVAVTIVNSTITGNFAAADRTGGILSDVSGANLVLRNTIVWGNGNGDGTAPQIVNTSTFGSNTATNSIIQGGQFGALDANPLFVTPLTASSTPSTAGNFQLGNLSPAIDAGANANVPVDSFDIDGDTNTSEDAPDRAGSPRRFNDTAVADTGSGTAPIVDLGAFERQSNSIPLPTVSISDVSVIEGTGAGSTTATFVVTISALPAANVTVDFASAGGTAISGTDFTAASGTLTFTPSGGLTRQVNVPITRDAIDETDEAFVVNLSTPVGLTIADGQGQGIIQDDDTAGVALSQTGASTAVTEDGTTDTYSLVLSSQPVAPVNVVIHFPPSQVTLNGDSDGTFSTSFTTANWNTPQILTVAAVNDRVLEGSHTAALGHLFNSADVTYNGITAVIDGVTSSNFLNVPITDNESAVLEWVPTSASATEGSSNLTAVRLDITANPIGGTPTVEGTISYTISTTLGSAEAADLGPISGALSFTNATDLATNTITIPHLDDTRVEGTEQYSLAITLGTAPLGTTVSATSFTGTIIDADQATVVMSGGGNINEQGARSVVVTLDTGAIGNTLENAVTAVVNLVDGTATYASGTGDFFFVGPSNTTTFTFPAGSAFGDSQAQGIVARNDALVEGNETLTAVFGTITGATGGNSPQSYTIVDNDTAAIAFQAASSSAPEGTTPHVVSATLAISANTAGNPSPGTPQLQNALSVAVNSTPGTATTPADYTLSSTSITFPAAATDASTQSINVAIVDDAASEGPETFSLGFGTVTGVGTASGTHTVTIIDNDAGTVTVTPTTGLVTTEAGGTATFTVVLNSQPTANVSIGLSSSDTTEGTVSPTSLTFTAANWNTAQTVTVTGVDDLVVDGNVAYTIVTAAAVSTDTAYNGVNAADVSVTNNDNDVAGITVTPTAGLTTTEAGGTATFTVLLNSQPTANVSIGLSSSDTTEGTVAPTSLTFTAANWNTAQTVTVTGVDDPVVDGNVAYTIVTAAAVSTDTVYNGINAADVGVTNTDNDVAGITVTPTAGLVTTESGGTATFTVVLATQPTANVVIGLSSSDTTEGTVAPTSLTFTAANWNTPQMVTVTGVDDLVIDGNVVYTIVTTPAVSTDTVYNGINPADVSVTNNDNDVAGITVTPTAGLVTTESGGTATFTVVLNTQPSADVTIGLSSNDTTEGTVAPTSLSFTAANWNTPQTVTVTGVDDPVVDGNVAYTIITAAAVSTDPNYNGVNPADVGVTNNDNDVAAITVTPTTGLVTTESGGTATFTVVLATQPTASVSIGLSSSDTTEGTVAPTSLSFTTANWNTPQTVTVTGVDDLVVDGNVAYTIVTAAAVSTDTVYNGVNPADVGVTNNDNDVAGITVTPTAGLVTTESGGTATFTVVLNTQPTADVTIGLSSNDTTEGTVAPTSLSFTTANWNAPRTVTVTGVDDPVVDGNVAYTIVTAPAVSTDTFYNGINAADVGVTNNDNDVAGITVTPTAGLTTTESGGTATFTVVLATQPTANVVIGLSSSDTTEGTVAPTSLTFTAANWNTAQTVTVTGVDDPVVDGNVAYTIVTAAAVSTDTFYNGINPADVSVTNTDNDVAGVTVTPTAGLITTEAGGSATFTVVLNTQPTANVSIGLSSSDTTEGTVAPTSLTFTAANWNTAQTVTVTGVDDLLVDGNVAYTIVTAPAVSTDTVYNGINAADVGVTNNDNDVAAITVTPTAGLTTTEAGGTATFTVVLAAQPTANVSIGLSSSDTTEGTVAPTSLSFTTANWNTPQTVTVTGVDDLIVDGNVAYTIITAAATSTDPNYAGVNPADVSVTNNDDDVAGITVTPTAGLVTTESGGTASFTVVLNTQPTANVSIGLSSSDTTEGTVAPTSLTFTAANWNTAQTVTVTGVDDPVVDGNVAYTIITAAAVSTDTVYNGINAADVGVTNNDNDVAGITVTPTVGLVTTEAGGTASFTVVLATQPTANVVIGLSSSDTTEGTVAPTSLTFTAANWNTAQTVTVTGVDDAIVDGNVAYTIVTAAATSTDTVYNGINPADVSVTNTDNDVAGITVTPSGGSTNVTEGGATDSYTLVLSSQPTADVTVTTNAGTQLTTSPTSATFTAANWNVAQTITVSAVDDALAEGTHSGSVTHTVTSADPNYQGRLVDSVSVTITDNDAAGVLVAESGGSTVVTEGGATDTISVVLSSQPVANVTVTVTPNAQLSVSPSPLTFTSANWNTPQTVTVTASDDAVVEGTHSGTLAFAVASSDPAYGSITLASITVAITDNDSAVLSFNPASVSQSEATSPMVFTVTLSAPVASGVTVTVNSANGTATAGADYTAISGQTVSFAPNSTTAQTVNVAITNDVLDEDNETYTLTLSGINATGNVTLGAATATGTIEDDDALPTLSVANVTQPEGNAANTLNFTVNLSPVSGRAVSFTRATVDGTAISTGPNADFVAIPAGSVTIPAGQTSVTIPVTINGDAVFEGDESFTLSLTGISNANPGTLTATATLTEDDQQPTTTTITADLPDPSVVGQPYPVTVEVRGQTLSPLGTVSITDGTGASCSATLTTATAPLSTMSCTLTSTTAGNQTLTATYTPASSAFGASSDTESHTVTAASTSLVLLGPARARIGTLATYTAELSVTAPGSGTPAGTVTVSSGSDSCTITLPTATPSCGIRYSTLGSRTVSATFAPTGSNYSGSTATPVQTLVFASADLSVTKTDGVNTYRPGDLLVYTVTVRNTGPDAAPQVRVRDVAPAGLTNVAWTCEATGGAVCPDAGGTGTLDHGVATLPSGGQLTYAYFGNVTGRPLEIVNVAEVTLPVDTTIEDPNLANNRASDSNQLDDLYADGFEAPTINSESGGVRLAGASLRSTLDEVARVTLRLSDVRGEALRVYARVVGGELQLALAVRSADGSLRLGAWQPASGEPQLTWTATETAGGFVLGGASLR